MKDKFIGADGARRLIEALRAQQIVEHRNDLAAELATHGELVEYAAGDVLIEQGAHD
jgi:hypothetical protein